MRSTPPDKVRCKLFLFTTLFRRIEKGESVVFFHLHHRNTPRSAACIQTCPLPCDPPAAATTPADRGKPPRALENDGFVNFGSQEGRGSRRGGGHGHAERSAARRLGVRDQPRRDEGVGEGGGRAAVLLRARGGGG